MIRAKKTEDERSVTPDEMMKNAADAAKATQILVQDFAEEKVKDLAEGLKEMKQLWMNSMGSNEMKGEGIKQIDEGFKKLQTLDLSWNDLSDKGAKRLASGIQEIKRLQQAYLSGNTAEGAQQFSKKLQELNLIQYLQLGTEDLKDKSKALALEQPKSVDSKPSASTSLCDSGQAGANTKVSDIVKQALGKDAKVPEWAVQNRIFSQEDLKKALRAAGLESSNLIIGIDFTSSNKDQGAVSFGGRSLHEVSNERQNPYEMVLNTIGQALAGFDDDNLIPLYSFGDVDNRHTSATMMGGAPCKGIAEACQQYRKAAAKAMLSGPTSFAPLINKAVETVRASGGQYHILLIIGDGAISDILDCTPATKDAIVRACDEPLSIVMIGVGDGPWDTMEDFDDGLPQRKFDNFQFVPFAPFQRELESGLDAAGRENVECAFAVAALQEVPEQYNVIKKLGLLERKGT